MDYAEDDRRAEATERGIIEQVNMASLALAERMAQLETIDGDVWLVLISHSELKEIVEALRARPDSAVKRATLPYLEEMLRRTHTRG